MTKTPNLSQPVTREINNEDAKISSPEAGRAKETRAQKIDRFLSGKPEEMNLSELTEGEIEELAVSLPDTSIPSEITKRDAFFANMPEGKLMKIADPEDKSTFRIIIGRKGVRHLQDCPVLYERYIPKKGLPGISVLRKYNEQASGGADLSNLSEIRVRTHIRVQKGSDSGHWSMEPREARWQRLGETVKMTEIDGSEKVTEIVRGQGGGISGVKETYRVGEEGELMTGFDINGKKIQGRRSETLYDFSKGWGPGREVEGREYIDGKETTARPSPIQRQVPEKALPEPDLLISNVVAYQEELAKRGT